eukprot:1148910-Pelagomonas_calceolata.AAC.3
MTAARPHGCMIATAPALFSFSPLRLPFLLRPAGTSITYTHVSKVQMASVAPVVMFHIASHVQSCAAFHESLWQERISVTSGCDKQFSKMWGAVGQQCCPGSLHST